MIKLGLAFVSTRSHRNFRTLVNVSSYSLVLVSRYERVATARNFYTEDAHAKFRV
jgi:hypothetical protein